MTQTESYVSSREVPSYMQIVFLGFLLLVPFQQRFTTFFILRLVLEAD
jgi:hypothetical protein